MKQAHIIKLATGRMRPATGVRRRGARLRAWGFLGVALVVSSLPASAHRAATSRAPLDGGLLIPNLSHGQMVVIAAHSGAIMALAAQQIPTDPEMRRLAGYISLQRFACMWGVIPGSLQDEDSPFNECAHAYLAATRSLLLHLQGMPGDRRDVDALVTRIELEMLVQHASLVLCRYSDEPFNTAEIIAPHWAAIPTHAPTSMTFGGLGLAMAGCGWLALRRGRPESALRASPIGR